MHNTLFYELMYKECNLRSRLKLYIWWYYCTFQAYLYKDHIEVVNTHRGHSWGVESVAWQPAGNLIVSGSYDKTAMVQIRVFIVVCVCLA